MSTRTLRGKAAVVGVGETTYWRHGKSPHSEFKLALLAILAAAEDAGIDPRRIDGFASYSNDRNDPSRIAAALGLPALRFSNMNWGGGGGGCGHVVHAPREDPDEQLPPAWNAPRRDLRPRDCRHTPVASHRGQESNGQRCGSGDPVARCNAPMAMRYS